MIFLVSKLGCTRKLACFRLFPSSVVGLRQIGQWLGQTHPCGKPL